MELLIASYENLVERMKSGRLDEGDTIIVIFFTILLGAVFLAVILTAFFVVVHIVGGMIVDKEFAHLSVMTVILFTIYYTIARKYKWSRRMKRRLHNSLSREEVE